MNTSDHGEKNSIRKRLSVILVKPENPENIGLVARNMKNTGFGDLRLVKVRILDKGSYITAVHAREILEKAHFYPDTAHAIQDLDIVCAATSKSRKSFSSLSFKEAIETIFRFPSSTKIGLLFGNERIGLTSEELRCSNYRFTIPQASIQPSYNLASAVLISLFQIYIYQNSKKELMTLKKPISWEKQEECIHLILDKLESVNFIHRTNKRHVTEMIYDLFGRLSMSSKDRDLLLALFSKGLK